MRETWRAWWSTHERRLDSAAGISLTISLFVLFAFAVVGSRPLDAAYMARALWILFPFLGVSILATLASFAMGFPIGFLVGWARTFRGESLARLWGGRSTGNELHPLRDGGLGHFAGRLAIVGARRMVRRVADGYVEIMRGTPLFVQILFTWSFIVIQFPGTANPALLAGIVAMTLNTGGYQGEIFRAGFQSVQAGQVEAARAIGLTRFGVMRYVVTPQAVRLVIPPLLNELIGLFKSSALLFYLGAQELTFKYKELATFETRIFELFAVVTFLYLAFTIPLSKLVGYVERRYRIPGLGAEAVRVGIRRRGPAIAS